MSVTNDLELIPQVLVLKDLSVCILVNVNGLDSVSAYLIVSGDSKIRMGSCETIASLMENTVSASTDANLDMSTAP